MRTSLRQPKVRYMQEDLGQMKSVEVDATEISIDQAVDLLNAVLPGKLRINKPPKTAGELFALVQVLGRVIGENGMREMSLGNQRFGRLTPEQQRAKVREVFGR